jgi:hypothetical protein
VNVSTEAEDTGECSADWEDSVRAVENCRMCGQKVNGSDDSV